MAHDKPTKKRVSVPPSRAARARSDSGDAFFPDPGGGAARTRDAFANELAEDFLGSATSGETQADARDRELTEEVGGPFITTSGREEFARGTDRSNPKGSTREPFPTVSRGKG